MRKPPFYIIAFALTLIASSASAQVTFTDVSQEAGLTGQGPNSLAVAWGDYDNDGDLDLYVAHGGWDQPVEEADVLYRNNGDGTFTDVTGEAGLAGNMGGAWYAGFMDYDNDGYLDLHVDQEGVPDVTPFALHHNNGDGTFTDVTREAAIEFPSVSFYGTASTLGDYDNDGDLDMYIARFGPNVYYENNGDGTFTDATERTGLGDARQNANAASGDYDNDATWTFTWQTLTLGESQTRRLFFIAITAMAHSLM